MRASTPDRAPLRLDHLLHRLARAVAGGGHQLEGQALARPR
jgi:hypothetical protein